MKKLSILLVCAFFTGIFISNIADAQPLNISEKKEVYDKEHIPKKDPIPYPFVREADVMWEKVIWRMVNLREKVNHPLYFPTSPIGDRKNLLQTLIDALKTPTPGHPIYAYEPLLDYEFQQPINYEKVIERLEAEPIIEPVTDSLGVTTMQQTGMDFGPAFRNASRLFIKEKWYFDRKYSTLNVRIIGLCPMIVEPRMLVDANTGEEVPTGDIDQRLLFWVYYPEARYYLARQESFNISNDSQAISFDDLFMQRRFSGYIYQESNVYNNRAVNTYAKGLDAMFEAERIKMQIFEFEHDLWEY